MSNQPLGAPIVLVHGLFGFGQLKLAGVGVADYFWLMPDALRAEGHVVPEPPYTVGPAPESQSLTHPHTVTVAMG
jgi:hypothetical protein